MVSKDSENPSSTSVPERLPLLGTVLVAVFTSPPSTSCPPMAPVSALFRSKPPMKAAPLAANCVLKSAALGNCPCEAFASA